MGTVLGELLPLAVGIAISPIPLVAAILMMLSRNGSGAAVGFAAGWVAGIAVATTVVLLIAGAVGGGGTHEQAAAVSWVKIGLGGLLLVLAVGQWRRRGETEPPGWMRSLDDFTPMRASGLGVLLSAVNPKNLLLCVSAGVAVGTSGLGAGGQVVAVAVFTVLAACGVLAVVVGYLLAADRLGPALDSTRKWLQANNHAVMAIVLLVMGSVVLGKGVGGL
ncbi:GAP family protein [Nocardia otitidiscaviarum]|uniref:GAP family protein n=1 Tax=Nocardia otitidiscaviarum TaxID=1823 RepID=A0A516NJU4_9NOCA|nr:GAP family protein [Nocardia otitidiscaviarum]MCP9620563.1 GAP family protein [Nocardia otitidiscaviarum]QDP79172.1 GAP family protein [Nocardia otitidiscaviarum]